MATQLRSKEDKKEAQILLKLNFVQCPEMSSGRLAGKN